MHRFLLLALMFTVCVGSALAKEYRDQTLSCKVDGYKVYRINNVYAVTHDKENQQSLDYLFTFADDYTTASMAYNPLDKYLYAINGDRYAHDGVFRINRLGEITPLNIPDLPAGITSYAGAIDRQGNFYIHEYGTPYTHKIDLKTNTYVKRTKHIVAKFGNDMDVHPKKQTLFTYAGDKNIYEYDLDTGKLINAYQIEEIPYGKGAGSQWFDQNGDFYIWLNQGNQYQIGFDGDQAFVKERRRTGALTGTGDGASVRCY